PESSHDARRVLTNNARYLAQLFLVVPAPPRGTQHRERPEPRQAQPQEEQCTRLGDRRDRGPARHARHSERHERPRSGEVNYDPLGDRKREGRPPPTGNGLKYGPRSKSRVRDERLRAVKLKIAETPALRRAERSS